ncbi:MAG: thiamine pyrophosphate-dependent enzyme [Candidatus Brocadiales bacterium]|nr:thiamine pyrophosphate-dependent enzyme [Candidatus Bathyanammoxibius amoris]
MKDTTHFQRFLKDKNLPTPWCPGCGNGLILKSTCDAFDELNFDMKKTVVVSGIGCAGRSAGFFNLDTVHTAHGRAIPMAEGIKTADEKLNVVVLSGDGDLLGIGGNHLIHASRRNTPITIICFSNEIYGMTGGQVSPTSKLGAKTITTPDGSRDTPINIQAIIKAHNCFYARTSTFHLKHLKKSIVAALRHPGFTFVDVICQCIVNNGRRIGFKDGYEMLMYYKDAYKIKDNTRFLEENEIGITK